MQAQCGRHAPPLQTSLDQQQGFGQVTTQPVEEGFSEIAPLPPFQIGDLVALEEVSQILVADLVALEAMQGKALFGNPSAFTANGLATLGRQVARNPSKSPNPRSCHWNCTP